jgi:alkanesulfonate monooxygenase SsuD/methylene tetrahydromethanopterin reductase-like flavin-dependent oxidoreductase (luciferase family)
VKVGVFLKLIASQERRTKHVDEVVALAVRAEQLGYDSVWVMDHLFSDRPGIRVPAHDPLQLLAAIAARTERVQLGALVICGPFRLPVQLARESATLQEASRGRYICGLGAGWNQPEFDAAGIPFGQLVSRLKQQVEEYKRLLDEPGLIPAGERPPLWIGGSGPRMLRLVARVADGWNLAWEGENPARWIQFADALRGALREAGRDERRMTFSAGIMAVVAEGEEADRYRQLQADVPCACGPPETVAAVLRRYADAGCDHAILALSPNLSMDLDAQMLEPVAAVLPLLR